MRNFIASLLRYRPLMVVCCWRGSRAASYFSCNSTSKPIPDPSPPLVEVITQNPSWSAEEMERQVTVPVETVLFGIPHLQYVRSITIFGLSDVKLYFSYDSNYLWDRQEALNRLQQVTLPANLSPQLSPWSPVGEIYRYRLVGPGYTLNELKATRRLVRRARDQASLRNYRRHVFRRQHARIHRGNRSAKIAAIQRHAAAGGLRHRARATPMSAAII